MTDQTRDPERWIVLGFRMDENQFRSILGGDAPAAKYEGITVESIASVLVGKHDPALGYIHWSVHDREVMPDTAANPSKHDDGGGMSDV